MKRISKYLLVSAMAITCFPQIATAGVWQERELLERWIAQTESLMDILDEAEYNADSNRRTQMNYQALKKDIRLNELKVKHYLDAPTVPFEQYTKDQGEVAQDQHHMSDGPMRHEGDLNAQRHEK